MGVRRPKGARDAILIIIIRSPRIRIIAKVLNLISIIDNPGHSKFNSFFNLIIIFILLLLFFII